MASEDIFYVGVKDPIGLRKSILEASKDIIELLRRYEHISKLKEKRTQKMSELREVSADIAKLANKLRMKLPSVEGLVKGSEKEMRKMAKEMTPQQKEIMKIKKKVAKTPGAKAISEVKRLEKELSEIEGKLKKISQ